MNKHLANKSLSIIICSCLLSVAYAATLLSEHHPIFFSHTSSSVSAEDHHTQAPLFSFPVAISSADLDTHKVKYALSGISPSYDAYSFQRYAEGGFVSFIRTYIRSCNSLYLLGCVWRI